MAIDLAESRKKIDDIDAQIVRLFEERMNIASDVADYKVKQARQSMTASARNKSSTL
ncbi:MAG: chorismate mutase [Eubacterium sp.]|nr:chorismate mutase [Eubacterium sp.]